LGNRGASKKSKDVRTIKSKKKMHRERAKGVYEGKKERGLGHARETGKRKAQGDWGGRKRNEIRLTLGKKKEEVSQKGRKCHVLAGPPRKTEERRKGGESPLRGAKRRLLENQVQARCSQGGKREKAPILSQEKKGGKASQGGSFPHQKGIAPKATGESKFPQGKKEKAYYTHSV